MQAPSLLRERCFVFSSTKKDASLGERGVLCPVPLSPEPHQPHFCTLSYLFPTAQSGNESCAAVPPCLQIFSSLFRLSKPPIDRKRHREPQNTCYRIGDGKALNDGDDADAL